MDMSMSIGPGWPFLFGLGLFKGFIWEFPKIGDPNIVP